MHGKHAATERTLDELRNGRVPKAKHALYPENLRRGTRKGGGGGERPGP